MNSTGAAGWVVAAAQAADSAGTSVDTSVGADITGWTFLSVRDFEFADVAASGRMLKWVDFSTALVPSPCRMTGRIFSADLLFDTGRLELLPGLG